MRIEKYLNCSKEEVESRTFNIYIGISLGNKYFSPDNIKAYVEWSLKYSKEKVLLMVFDLPYAIDLEYFSNYNTNRALNKALRMGQKLFDVCREIINALPLPDRKKCYLVRWEQLKINETYQKNRLLIEDEFKNNAKFRNFILDIVNDHLKNSNRNLSENSILGLSGYIVEELPFLVTGLEYKGEFFDFHPYPGFSKLEELFIGINQGKLFKDLANKLKVKQRAAGVEAYVN